MTPSAELSLPSQPHGTTAGAAAAPAAGATVRVSDNELRGQLHVILWRSREDEQTHSPIMIAKLADGVVVKGPIDFDDLPSPGIHYRFHGKWTTHEKHGNQFAYQTLTRIVPHDRAGIMAYLVAVAENVGESRARRLWDAFGGEAVAALRDDPDRVAALGIMPLAAAQEASAALTEDAKFQDTKIDLLGLFAGRGFQAAKLIKECLRRWGADAPAIVRKNPYLLMLKKLPSAGFKRCDKLYLDLGGEPARLKRQTLCAIHWIRTSGRGDTWFAAKTVGTAIQGCVPMGKSRPVEALRLGIRAGMLQRRRVEASTNETTGTTGPEVFIAESRKADNEATVAAKVRLLLEGAAP